VSVVGARCECELLILILASTTPTSLRFRKSTQQDGQVSSKREKKSVFEWCRFFMVWTFSKPLTSFNSIMHAGFEDHCIINGGPNYSINKSGLALYYVWFSIDPVIGGCSPGQYSVM